ncbi:MAG: hypothetical protein OXH13_01980 [Chloroflexi bacterium]|nr:hypothetical protein [Chloroflexota bacterium]MCY3697405.1 hypothetical protein [Chloroflexota bacterium]
MVADLPQYISGEGVSWIETWPWIQTAGLCGEEVTSDFEDLPRPGHGLTSASGPTEALREASRMFGLEWEDWDRVWFDREGVTLYTRTAWQGGSREYAAASLYLVYQGDPPRWDEAQSSVTYVCDEAEAARGGRPLPPPLYVELEGEQIDVRYGAVLALLDPGHLPDVDLERSCSWFNPGSVDHRYGRHQAMPHGLPAGTPTASDLPESLRTAAVRTRHERPLHGFEFLWVTEHRVMAFSRSPLEGSRNARLAEVREFALIQDNGDERWVELASGVVWDCSDATPKPMLVEPPNEIPASGGLSDMLSDMYGHVGDICVSHGVTDPPAGWELPHGVTEQSAPPPEVLQLLSQWDRGYQDYQHRWFSRYRIVLLYQAWAITSFGREVPIAFALDIRKAYSSESEREYWEIFEGTSIGPCDSEEEYEIVYER